MEEIGIMLRLLLFLSLFLGLTTTSHAAIYQVHQYGEFDSGSIFDANYKFDTDIGSAFDFIGTYTNWNGIVGSATTISTPAFNGVSWNYSLSFDNGGSFYTAFYPNGPNPYNQVFGTFSGPDNQWNTLSINTASPVPLPPAVWLLGSALIGLVGVSRKKR
jgi:hypothetical protein